MNYNKTIRACFVGYIVQAIVNNFVPLLFLTFQKTYSVPLSQITSLITVNFGIQLLVDLLSAGFIDKIGYRASAVTAHIVSALGLICLTFLPELCAQPYVGILVSVTIYAIGGGLLEVLVSPIVEACPTDNKERAMSMLHSFYCWGHVGVVLLSTIFFTVFGIENWKVLLILWSLIPLANAAAFAKVPIASLTEDGEGGMSVFELAKTKIFWTFMVMMMCSGASEQAVSQWASVFAEKGLGVTKAVGDLAGPMAFAVLMGTSRALYGKFGGGADLSKFMGASCILCIISYLCIAFIPIPIFGLIGCAVCGLSVGIMWPGTFSKASASLKNGGTVMFAMLALAGDLGCSGGPTLVGAVSSVLNENLNMGILSAVVFPVSLLICVCVLQRCAVQR